MRVNRDVHHAELGTPRRDMYKKYRIQCVHTRAAGCSDDEPIDVFFVGVKIANYTLRYYLRDATVIGKFGSHTI